MRSFSGKAACLAALILAAALLFAGCTPEHKVPEIPEETDAAFSPDTVEINAELGSIPAPPCDDSDTVAALYELYGKSVLTGKSESPDTVRSLDIIFHDKALGESRSWTVCRDGSCRLDDEEGYYFLENGAEIYARVKSAYEKLRDVESYAAALYELRTPYIGDAAANGAVLRALAIEDMVGSYTVELQTESEPYGLVLHVAEGYRQLPVSELDKLMGRFGHIYLALVENAAYFSWDYDTPSGFHHSGVYSGVCDVKQYGESYEKFYDLCVVADSLSQAEVHPADISISTGDSADYVMYGAPAGSVDKLWEMAASMELEAVDKPEDEEAAINLMFFDSDGKLIKVYSLTSTHCRIDGGGQYFKIAGGDMSAARVRAIYEASQNSEDYSWGIYLHSQVFKVRNEAE